MSTDWKHELKALGTRLLEQAPPVTADEVFRRDVQLTSRARPLDVDVVVPTARTPRPPRTRTRTFAAAAAVAAIAGGLGIATQLRDRPVQTSVGQTSTPPTEAPATTNPQTSPPPQELEWPPRLSLGDAADDWTLTLFGEGGTPAGVTDGYSQYRNESSDAQLIVDYDFQAPEITPMYATNIDASVVATATLLGQSIEIHGYPPLVESTPGEPLVPDPDASIDQMVSFSATVPFDQHVLHIQANELSVDEFVGVVESMQLVSTETWEAQLPAEYVRVAERPAAVDAALEGVPTPDGFDPEPLRSTPAVRSETDLNLEIGTAVACAWIDVWAGATNAGDTATADAAAQTLGTAREWNAFNGQPNELHAFVVADAISTGTLYMPNTPAGDIGPIDIETGEPTETTTPGPEITPSNAGGWLECPHWNPVSVG